MAELDRHGVARAALIASIPGRRSVGRRGGRAPSRPVRRLLHAQPGGHGCRRAARAKSDRMEAARDLPFSGDARLSTRRCVGRAGVPRPRPVTAPPSSCTAACSPSASARSSGCRADSTCGSAIRWRSRGLRSAFPPFPVIIPHFGAGFFREALMAADQCPTIHLDTSSSNSWTKFHARLDARRMSFDRRWRWRAPPACCSAPTRRSFPAAGSGRSTTDSASIVEELGVPAADRERALSRKLRPPVPASYNSHHYANLTSVPAVSVVVCAASVAALAVARRTLSSERSDGRHSAAAGRAARRPPLPAADLVLVNGRSSRWRIACRKRRRSRSARTRSTALGTNADVRKR